MGGQSTIPPLLSLLLLLSNSVKVIAQDFSILPTTSSSTFPACALECERLNSAASYCIETNTGASEDIINSCFCQRAEVTPLNIGPTGVCDGFCPDASDLSTLQTWFQGYCATAGFDGSAGVPRTTLITSTRSPSSTATGTSGTGSDSGATSSPPQNNGWFASHWQWIVMLIVLVIGLTALAVLAVFLKRRHARKVDQRRAASFGLPAAQGASPPDTGHGRDMWGPHQHMAHTGGWEYTTEQDREIRAASTEPGGGVLGSVVGKAKGLGAGSKRKLSRKSRHGSQRSARQTETDPSRARGEEGAGGLSTGAPARSRRERRSERERERNGETESVARGWPIEHNDKKAGKEKSFTNIDERRQPPMSERGRGMNWESHSR